VTEPSSATVVSSTVTEANTVEDMLPHKMQLIATERIVLLAIKIASKIEFVVNKVHRKVSHRCT
jgi:hypothetical protein